MPQILRTTLIPNLTLAATAEVIQYNLPVNPLSAIIFTLLSRNEAAAVTDIYAWTKTLAKIANINVRYRGASIMDGNLADLAMTYAILSGWMPWAGCQLASDESPRVASFPLLFGRRPYDPKECMPATRSGDLVIQISTAADPTEQDGFILQAETIELLDAIPERFVKVTTTSQIFDAAGQHDVELPIGNRLLGMTLHGATVEQSIFTQSFGKIALKMDNVEVIYAETNWESLRGEMGRVLGSNYAWASPTALNLNSMLAFEADHNRNYAYMDLDPTDDGMYALDTRGAARLNLRVTSDVIDSVASRVLPVEMVETGAQPAGEFAAA